jgi:hypothetical protein
MTTTHSEIWKTLSTVNVSQHVEKKGNLSYLSWAWAWGTLMEHYPQAEFEMDSQSSVEADGSVTVWCEVAIDDCVRKMWLPVMDNRNNAVSSPNAREISDARMRCLVKCLALFGLGFSLYAGEDLPAKPSRAASPKKPALSEGNKERLRVAAELKSAELEDDSLLPKQVTIECLKAMNLKWGQINDTNFSDLFSQIQQFEPGREGSF